jgi:ribosomal-protein-alanine N-acetyltransferase
MTPSDMAGLHARCFDVPRPWSEAEFRALATDEAVQLLVRKAGFIMLRITLDEAEILTLAVAPEARRTGVGHALLADAITAAKVADCSQVFLEVSENNRAAIKLYENAGFQRAGRRKAYYRAPDGTQIDALILGKSL